MGYQIATVALGPLLMWQGRSVRRHTRRLPEPTGPRGGTTGTGPPLRVLLVGDSSAAGVGVPTQDTALSGRVVAALANRYRVTWMVIAKTGWTTRRTIDRLIETPSDRFDVAVTALGVNDVTRRRPLTEWLTDQKTLWETLRQRWGVASIVVSGLPPVHRFTALPQPLRWYLGRRATRFDAALAQITSGAPDLHYLGMRHGDTPAMASDGFHPGAAAYADWGRRVAATISGRI